MTKNEWTGLTPKQVAERQQIYGKNELAPKQRVPFYQKILHVIAEPMFILLLAAAMVYFVLGEPLDGGIMLIFVVGIITIETMQEWKTDQTLHALKDLSAPKIMVIREGVKQEILSADLVPGDIMLIEEGVKIPADGLILQASDLQVDESSLTGEAEGIWKCVAEVNSETAEYWRRDYVYTGTMVTTGSGTILVEKIGTQTEYGRIGEKLEEAQPQQSRLARQINQLVKICGIIACLFFLLVTGVTFFNEVDLPLKERIIQSILSGITIAMAMIPEEFPVVLTIFLSMGAWRLAKKQSLIRKLPAIETMGSVTVLAVDKTGTITENKMTVTEVLSFQGTTAQELCQAMVLASEIDPYDPMEIAMLEYARAQQSFPMYPDELAFEYPFTDELKMMGHVWQDEELSRIVAKGAPESLLRISQLTSQQKAAIIQQAAMLSAQGLRVIAVGEQICHQEAIPTALTDCQLTFLGLIGLADPPRPLVKRDIADCQRAGIRVVMITGDNGATASAIAQQVGINQRGQVLTGQEIQNLSAEALAEKVRKTAIFSRVTPEHKMRIVQAFQTNGEVVAMTGDGVNDAPALKHADVGIAMGKRGSEVAREAADMVLLDDNFQTIVQTIKDGRRIYDNIKKAIGYILVIHIPIALTAFLGPLLEIPQTALMLLPLHVVLLELVIDPTCSIVLERQPSEPDIMKHPPRKSNEALLTKGLLVKSLLQGTTIFAAAFGLYYWGLQQSSIQETAARTMGITTLIMANLILVLVNSSQIQSAVQAAKYLLKDRVVWFVFGGTVMGLLGFIYSPLCQFFNFAPLTIGQLAICMVMAFASAGWYEVIKLFRNCRETLSKPQRIR